jgi:hypothetical protein
LIDAKGAHGCSTPAACTVVVVGIAVAALLDKGDASIDDGDLVLVAATRWTFITHVYVLKHGREQVVGDGSVAVGVV